MTSAAKRVGILGGTFDPIHLGHLNLATQLQEKHRLDEIWFIPVQVNPHKLTLTPASADHRLAMLKLALKPYPTFFVKDLELKRPPPSFTLDTLKVLKNEEPDTQFFLLVGEDLMGGFSRWHQPQEIIKLAPLLIGSRTGDWKSDAIEDLAILEAIRAGMTPTALLTISATELRHRLAQNLPCSQWIPEDVLEYIKKHHLYQVS
jgi:nicotinate-nucleotide adenylyltransferase